MFRDLKELQDWQMHPDLDDRDLFGKSANAVQAIRKVEVDPKKNSSQIAAKVKKEFG